MAWPASGLVLFVVALVPVLPRMVPGLQPRLQRSDGGFTLLAYPRGPHVVDYGPLVWNRTVQRPTVAWIDDH